MDLTIQDWGAIGEILGAIAVVFTLIYLAWQIKLNSKATRANASYDATHSWASFLEEMWKLNDSTLEALERTFDPNYQWEDLAGPEKMRLNILHRALFQKLEGQYYLYKYGSLEKPLWTKRSNFVSSLIQLPFYQKWWIFEKQSSIYSDEFVQAIDSIDSTDHIQVTVEGRKL